MKIQTSSLIGKQLDWAVAKIEGMLWLWEGSLEGDCPGTAYSTDKSLSGPIIKREKILIVEGNPIFIPHGNEHGKYYEPQWFSEGVPGPHPLISAMRCYVRNKLGETVEIPDELA